MAARFAWSCVYAVILCQFFIKTTGEGLWDGANSFAGLGALKERRARQTSGDGGGSPYELFSTHEEFLSDLNKTLEALNANHSPVLVHTTGDQETDVLVFVTNSSNFTVPILASSYYNLKAISHLPVRVISILLPDVLANSSLSSETIQRLGELQEALKNVNESLQGDFLTQQQVLRAVVIIETVSSFVNIVTTTMTTNLSMEALRNFSVSLQDQLRANGNESVQEYLKCVNATITEKLLENDLGNLVVIIAHQQFAYPGSFLTQYYEQLLNFSYSMRTLPDKERIVLIPTINKLPTTADITPSLYALSDTVLQHTISWLFNNATSLSPVHIGLDTAASAFICSSDFNFSSCDSDSDSEPKQQKLPPGFQSRIERIYAIVLIALATVACVFGIVVVCIVVEDRVMKSERMEMYAEHDKAMSRTGGPTVLTPLDGPRQRSKTMRSTTSSNGTGTDSDTLKLLNTEADPKSEISSTL